MKRSILCLGGSSHNFPNVEHNTLIFYKLVVFTLVFYDFFCEQGMVKFLCFGGQFGCEVGSCSG